MDELISIVVPVYNAEQYIDMCIASIINQTYKNLEIILVDDGSTDNSGAICDDYSLRDNRVKVIHKENGGVSSARNVGISIATGRYIGFVDSDDYIHCNMYEFLYNCIVDSASQLAVCNFCSGGFDNEITYTKGSCTVYDNVTAMSKMILGKPFAGHMCNKLLQTDIAKQIKLNEEIYMYEDLLYLWEYLKLCKKAIYIPASLYMYRQNNESVSYAKYNYKHETAFMVLEKVLNDSKTDYKEIYPYAVASNMLICSDFAVIELRDRRSKETNKWLKVFRKRLKKVYSKEYLSYLGSNLTKKYVKLLRYNIYIFKVAYVAYNFISKLRSVVRCKRIN